MVFKVRWVDSSEYLAHCADTKAALRYSVSFLWSVESRGWNAIILNCIVVKEESLKTVCRDWCHLKYVFFLFSTNKLKGLVYFNMGSICLYVLIWKWFIRRSSFSSVGSVGVSCTEALSSLQWPLGLESQPGALFCMSHPPHLSHPVSCHILIRPVNLRPKKIIKKKKRKWFSLPNTLESIQ